MLIPFNWTSNKCFLAVSDDRQLWDYCPLTFSNSTQCRPKSLCDVFVGICVALRLIPIGRVEFLELQMRRILLVPPQMCWTQTKVFILVIMVCVHMRTSTDKLLWFKMLLLHGLLRVMHPWYSTMSHYLYQKALWLSSWERCPIVQPLLPFSQFN